MLLNQELMLRMPLAKMQKSNTTAKQVQQALRRVATKDRAKTNAWFFKTGKGQYGEGDIFIGVTVPVIRRIAKDYGDDLSLREIAVLLSSKIHEERLAGLEVLVLRYEKGSPADQEKYYKFYLRHRKSVNNWDLVDTSAPYIVGAHLFTRDRAPLYAMVRSKRLWERRIAIVATQYFIRQGDFDETLALSELLLQDKEDLLHKAVGWMLREVGKKDEKVLTTFLTKHKTALPRTALRYAIERLSQKQKQFYMKK